MINIFIWILFVILMGFGFVGMIGMLMIVYQNIHSHFYKKHTVGETNGKNGKMRRYRGNRNI